jgi:hypothetical protein
MVRPAPVQPAPHMSPPQVRPAHPVEPRPDFRSHGNSGGDRPLHGNPDGERPPSGTHQSGHPQHHPSGSAGHGLTVPPRQGGSYNQINTGYTTIDGDDIADFFDDLPEDGTIPDDVKADEDATPTADDSQGFIAVSAASDGTSATSQGPTAEAAEAAALQSCDSRTPQECVTVSGTGYVVAVQCENSDGMTRTAEGAGDTWKYAAAKALSLALEDSRFSKPDCRALAINKPGGLTS